MQDANNLKQLGLAMHFYYDTYKYLPSPKTQQLEAGVSAILPYVEQGPLYNGEFHHDEPWDSTHNKKDLRHSPDAHCLSIAT